MASDTFNHPYVAVGGDTLTEPLLAPYPDLHTDSQGLKRHATVHVVEETSSVQRQLAVDKALSLLYGSPNGPWSYISRFLSLTWDYIGLLLLLITIAGAIGNIALAAVHTYGVVINSPSDISDNNQPETVTHTFAACPSPLPSQPEFSTVSFAQTCGGSQNIIGQTGYAVLGGVLTAVFFAMSCIFRYIRRRPGRLLSKKSRQLLGGLFKGAHRGTFMVSYSWDRDCDLARDMAFAFPYPTCWLDVQNLLPGRSVYGSCAQAASSADVGIVFLSTEYLYSSNCLTELVHFEPRLREVLEEHMGKDYLEYVPLPLHNKACEWTVPEILAEREHQCHLIVYAHSEVRANPIGAHVLRVLRSLGHCVYEDNRVCQHWKLDVVGRKQHFKRCTCFKELKDNPGREILRALLTHLVPCEESFVGTKKVSLGQALYQRQDFTPAITEDWKGTCAPFIWSIHTRQLVGWFGIAAASASMVGFSSSPVNLSSGLKLTGVILAGIVIAAFLPITLAIKGNYKAFDFRGYNRLSDTAWLLVLLRHLRLIDPIPVYFSTTSDLRTSPFRDSNTLPVIRLLEQQGVLRQVQFNRDQQRDIATGKVRPEDCLFALLNLDEVMRSSDNSHARTDDSGRCLFWASSTFPELIKKAGETNLEVAHSMIQIVTSRKKSGLKMETVYLQVLKRALGLEESKAFITVGKYGFDRRSVDLQFKNQQGGLIREARGLVGDAKGLTRSLADQARRQISTKAGEAFQNLQESKVSGAVKQKLSLGVVGEAIDTDEEHLEGDQVTETET